MRLLFGADAAVAQWVSEHIPHMAGEPFGACAALGVVDDAEALRAGVVYHNWNERYRSIELSCASDSRTWARPDIVRALLRYPFGQLHCNRLTSVTPRRSDQPRRFLEHLGFKREGLARFGFGDDHAVIYGLLRKEWEASPLSQPRAARIGAASHGQERPQAAAGP